MTWGRHCVVEHRKCDPQGTNTLRHTAKKSSGEETRHGGLSKKFNELEQEVKKETDVTTQFWGSVVQDEQLEKLATRLKEVEG